MFNKDTFKSKTFWMGIITVATGVVAFCYGEADKGIGCIIAGGAMITGRDAIQKTINKDVK